MHVIGAGFGRTGTLSLKAALEQLGFAPCLHMVDLIRTGERVELVGRGGGRRSGRLAGGVGGLRGDRGLARVFVLRAADGGVPGRQGRPDGARLGRVVRQHRAHVYAAQAAIRENELSGGTQPPPSAELMRVISTLIWDGTFGGRFTERDHAIAVFERHNEAVKATVPADRLLVYEVAEGWEPLARFLGVERPDTPFPRLNDTAAFREMVGMAAL